MVFESSTSGGAAPDTAAIGAVLAGIPEIFAAVSGGLAGIAGVGDAGAAEPGMGDEIAGTRH